jgi:cell division protease FtsH
VGADIENLVNEAAIVAARQGKKTILHRHFEEAIERVVLGPERRSRIMTEDERRVLAYHEAGHAIVMHLSPKCNPIRKITIIPRGISGGVTWSVPETDENLLSRSKLKDMIAGALGGRGAEEIVFGDITTGAANDLDQVSRIARNMVTRYGMSEKLGPMIYGKKEELVFLGREIGEQRDYSEYVAQEIDNEVRRIVSEAHEQARQILRQNREKLDLLADQLLEIETVDRDEFLRLMGDEPEESEQNSGLTDEAHSSQRGAEDSGKGPMMEIPPAPAPA